MNWSLEFCFHFPHDRFALGWEFMDKDEEYNYRTVKLYLFIVTITMNF
jgi:hypothetical protein